MKNKDFKDYEVRPRTIDVLEMVLLKENAWMEIITLWWKNYDEIVRQCMDKLYSNTKLENIYWWEAIKYCRWQDIDKVLEARRKQQKINNIK